MRPETAAEAWGGVQCLEGQGWAQRQHGRAGPLDGLPVDLTHLSPGLRRDLEKECDKKNLVKGAWSMGQGGQRRLGSGPGY